MHDRRFRFGALAKADRAGAELGDFARHVEDLG
jgi:hypothetical protein